MALLLPQDGECLLRLRALASISDILRFRFKRVSGAFLNVNTIEVSCSFCRVLCVRSIVLSVLCGFSLLAGVSEIKQKGTY